MFYGEYSVSIGCVFGKVSVGDLGGYWVGKVLLRVL